jgi:hypothetical protein
MLANMRPCQAAFARGDHITREREAVAKRNLGTAAQASSHHFSDASRSLDGLRFESQPHAPGKLESATAPKQIIPATPRW